jgi:hypothetical protein
LGDAEFCRLRRLAGLGVAVVGVHLFLDFFAVVIGVENTDTAACGEFSVGVD